MPINYAIINIPPFIWSCWLSKWPHINLSFPFVSVSVPDGPLRVGNSASPPHKAAGLRQKLQRHLDVAPSLLVDLACLLVGFCGAASFWGVFGFSPDKPGAERFNARS